MSRSLTGTNGGFSQVINIASDGGTTSADTIAAPLKKTFDAATGASTLELGVDPAGFTIDATLKQLKLNPTSLDGKQNAAANLTALSSTTAPTLTGPLSVSTLNATTQLNSARIVSEITTDAAHAMTVKNASAGVNAFSWMQVANNGASSLNMILNSSARTADGGGDNATVRNDAGDLNLQSKEGLGMRIDRTTGHVSMTGGTVFWPSTIGAPTTTTRSAGTKLALYKGVSAADVDYALGVEGGALWYSAATTGDRHRFYCGPTNVATIANNSMTLHRADTAIEYALASNIVMGRSGGAGQYLSASALGDVVIRNTTNRILLGASTATAHVLINTDGSVEIPGTLKVAGANATRYTYTGALPASTAGRVWVSLRGPDDTVRATVAANTYISCVVRSATADGDTTFPSSAADGVVVYAAGVEPTTANANGSWVRVNIENKGTTTGTITVTATR